MLFLYFRAGEPAYFLAAPAPDFFQVVPAPAPAPGSFFKRLRLQGAKNTWLRAAPAPQPCFILLLFFFRSLSERLGQSPDKKKFKQTKEKKYFFQPNSVIQ